MYKSIIDNARGLMPDIGISCDILVGFPGETEKQFENSVELVKYAESVKTHVFGFSVREGTPAVDMPNHLSKREIDKRCEYLREIAENVSVFFKKKQLNTENLRDKIRMVLTDPSYARNAMNISLKMQTYGGASGATDIIENFF